MTKETISILLVLMCNQWIPPKRSVMLFCHDDVMKWNHFPRYWPFVRGIHRSPVNSPHNGQWRGAFMLSLIGTSTNGWVNNQFAGDLRRQRAHYEVTVMFYVSFNKLLWKQSICPWFFIRNDDGVTSLSWVDCKSRKCQHIGDNFAASSYLQHIFPPFHRIIIFSADTPYISIGTTNADTHTEVIHRFQNLWNIQNFI